MAEQATSAERTPLHSESAEVAELREEILRLRDLLITRDAELGVARGRLAEHEAQVGKLLNLAAAIRGLVPTFLWTAARGLLRRLRS